MYSGVPSRSSTDDSLRVACIPYAEARRVTVERFRGGVVKPERFNSRSQPGSGIDYSRDFKTTSPYR